MDKIPFFFYNYIGTWFPFRTCVRKISNFKKLFVNLKFILPEFTTEISKTLIY